MNFQHLGFYVRYLSSANAKANELPVQSCSESAIRCTVSRVLSLRNYDLCHGELLSHADMASLN